MSELNRQQRRLLNAKGIDIDQALSQSAQPPPEYVLELQDQNGNKVRKPVSVITAECLLGINQQLAQIAYCLAVMSGQVYQEDERGVETSDNADSTSGTDGGVEASGDS